MSFTWQGTYFFNGQSFDEIEHAKALNAGIVNFIGEGFDFEDGNITRGHGINNGVPFVVGRTGELQDITPNFTGAIVVETTLSGSNSNTRIVEIQTVPASSNTVKYFKIYDFEEGLPIKDYRHVEYIKEFRVEKTGTNTFKFILNGYPSDEFTFPESGVMSINGELPVNGNVTLTANEVGAISELSIEIPDGADLNDYQSVGFYHSPLSANVIANVPIEGKAFTLLVEQTTADGWKQTWTNFETFDVDMYIRTAYNETWGEWQKIITDAGGEITGSLTIPTGTKIKGSGSGDANFSNIGFYEHDGATRLGYFGDTYSGSSTITIGSDKGNINMIPAAGFEATVNNNKIWHAGNMSLSLLDEKMIGYDDTIHATTPLQDILKDLFEKCQTSVGTNKPFKLTFLTRESSAYNINLGRELFYLVAEKYGTVIPPAELMTFEMNVSTASGFADKDYSGSNKCSVWSKNYYFEFEFDYDNWASVTIRDAAGYMSPQHSGIEICDAMGNNSTTINLTESVLNFSSISVGVMMGTAQVMRTHVCIPNSYVTGIYMSSIPYTITSSEVYYSNLAFTRDGTGEQLNPLNVEHNYVSYSRIRSNELPINYIDECGINKIWGHGRIYPRGTTHSIVTFDGKSYRKVTLPDGAIELKEVPIELQQEYISKR